MRQTQLEKHSLAGASIRPASIDASPVKTNMDQGDGKNAKQ